MWFVAQITLDLLVDNGGRVGRSQLSVRKLRLSKFNRTDTRFPNLQVQANCTNITLEKSIGLVNMTRAWQRMLSGRRLDLLDPTPVDIEITDIAHGLAFVARWNGQTSGEYAYSVAEHSLLVETLFGRVSPKAPVKWHLAALLHDAPEYVIGDMISPVKASVGPGYGALDDRLTSAIHLRFGLPAVLPKSVKAQIKRADKISAWMEAVQIAGFTETEANKLFGKPKAGIIDGLAIHLRAPIETRVAFTTRHAELLSQMPS
jgi:5'-deoxynucleotidase YfbR-like HD superfamily hydrolase